MYLFVTILHVSIFILPLIAASVSDGEKDRNVPATHCDKAEAGEPLEQLVIHHQTPLFTKRCFEDSSSHNQIVADTCKMIGQDAAKEVKLVLQPYLQRYVQIDIVVLDEDPEKKCIVDSSLECIKSQFYSFGFRSCQYQVCMELLKGRHHSSPGMMRHDVFFSAPCGYGKSLCFVVAAYALGGLTVS